MKFLFTKLTAISVLLLALATNSVADPEAGELVSSGRVNEAVTALATRQDAASLNLLSRAYFSMDSWDEAVKYGERAVGLEPMNSNYHLWLGRAYGRKAGDSNPLRAAGLAKKARNEFERAVQLDPANVPARVDLAQYYTEAPSFMGGGLDKARAQAGQVQGSDPAMAHLIQARVAEKDKRYSDAEAEYKSAIQQAKNPADMWLQLADFYRQRERYDDMQSAIQSAMAQPHKSAESYFDAGNQLFLSSRDFPAAVDYLQKYLASGELVESAPAFRAHYLMGQLQEKMGHNAAAATEYQASLALASGFAPATRALGQLAHAPRPGV
jgi:tetratricopeptide (TPR) repeat protein